MKLCACYFMPRNEVVQPALRIFWRPKIESVSKALQRHAGGKAHFSLLNAWMCTQPAGKVLLPEQSSSSATSSCKGTTLHMGLTKGACSQFMPWFRGKSQLLIHLLHDGMEGDLLSLHMSNHHRKQSEATLKPFSPSTAPGEMPKQQPHQLFSQPPALP